jgi:DNA-binding NarL/FixJ family response regulator
MRQCVVEELTAQTGFEVVGADAQDTLVMDLFARGGIFEPVSTVKALQNQYPDVKVLIFTANNSEMYFRRLIKACVRGYVRRDDNLALKLPYCVRVVAQGETVYS